MICFILLEVDGFDKQAVYKRSSIPIYTWNWLSVSKVDKVYKAEDCGTLCSLTNGSSNSFMFNASTSSCFLTYVGLSCCLLLLQRRNLFISDELFP